MKAIIVIDMPNSCDECPCCTWIPEYSEYGCGISGNLEDITDKPSWCPLRPLPEQMTWGRSSDYIEGYNACIEEIENG